jgi:site-specific recombinase XerD
MSPDNSQNQDYHKEASMARKIPEVLTATEQEALLKQPNPRYFTGHRNRVMLRLMLDTGLRLDEACSLEWRHIDLNSGKVMVRQGKGSKDRTLWTGESNLEQLTSWRERQATDGTRTELVFSTKEGGKLDPSYMRRMVKRYASKAGIQKRITPHTFRHTFATDLYRDSAKIRLVQKALGHANLATTQIYTHIVDEELEEALKSFRQPATMTA